MIDRKKVLREYIENVDLEINKTEHRLVCLEHFVNKAERDVESILNHIESLKEYYTVISLREYRVLRKKIDSLKESIRIDSAGVDSTKSRINILEKRLSHFKKEMEKEVKKDEKVKSNLYKIR